MRRALPALGDGEHPKAGDAECAFMPALSVERGIGMQLLDQPPEGHRRAVCLYEERPALPAWRLRLVPQDEKRIRVHEVAAVGGRPPLKSQPVMLALKPLERQLGSEWHGRLQGH